MKKMIPLLGLAFLIGGCNQQPNTSGETTNAPAPAEINSNGMSANTNMSVPATGMTNSAAGASTNGAP